MFVKDAKHYILWKILSCKKGPVVAEWKPRYASVFVVVRFIVEKLNWARFYSIRFSAFSIILPMLHTHYFIYQRRYAILKSERVFK